MNEADILAGRISVLQEIVYKSFPNANEKSQGFALRILGNAKDFPSEKLGEFDLTTAADSARYGGVPTAAYLGYGIGSMGRNTLITSIQNAFQQAVERLYSRSESSLREFASDDLALLGVADGLSVQNGQNNDETDIRNWLVQLIDCSHGMDTWSGRFHALAAELLDARGRLQQRVADSDHAALALDLCLRSKWPQVYQHAPIPDRAIQQDLMKTLLTSPPPKIGDLDRAVVWLQAITVLTEQTIASLVPSVSEVAQFLRNSQAALKRWVWDERSRRPNSDPAHWLIDNEYHVQSLLWAMLYPLFSEQLHDEIYLKGYGLTQPRADICIINLKLIIEVKFLRERSDFNKFEEQIAGDLGLYFAQPQCFNRLIAYIYDDCETHYPELYDILRSALCQRDARIEDVIIVRRPSMMPKRNARKTIGESAQPKP